MNSNQKDDLIPAALDPDEFRRHLKAARSKVFEKKDLLDEEYVRAASVLVHFDPDNLNPFTSGAQTDAIGPFSNSSSGPGYTQSIEGWMNFLRYCEPAVGHMQGNWWKLKFDVRRQALRELGTEEEMLKAMDANHRLQDDPDQKLFQSMLLKPNYLAGQLEKYSRSQLVTLSGILKWVDDILLIADQIKPYLTRALALADQLEPLQRLVKGVFVGRKEELLDLQDFVGSYEAATLTRGFSRFTSGLKNKFFGRSPLLLYGPGGVGKSTLIAKFIMQHVGLSNKSNKKIAFVYLDLDRSIFRLDQPTTLLIEAIRQLSIQFVEFERDFNHIRSQIEQDLDRTDYSQSFKSANSRSYHRSSDASFALAMLLEKIRRPILLVVDTFEEAQFLGRDRSIGIWEIFEALQEYAANLRVVVAGRAYEDRASQSLELGDLSQSEGYELLTEVLRDAKSSDKDLKSIIDVAGLNPLSLRLASGIVLKQGIEKLREVKTRTWLLLHVNSEVVQGRLYGRILSHIHDPQVRKLAFPGLVVRRIDELIIQKVLAGPCGLGPIVDYQAQTLLSKLAHEVSLVEYSPDGALRHRQDVRRIMLKDLKQQVPIDVANTIHKLAIEHYATRDDNVSRAEELYHRLSMNESREIIETRWRQGIEPFLSNALDELPIEAALWLATKLGITPSASLLEKASLEQWETITARAARNLLYDGLAERALTLLRQRSNRSHLSPLYRIELEALNVAGSLKEALLLAEQILPIVEKSSDAFLLRDILMQAASIAEAMDDDGRAVKYIARATGLLGDQLVDVEWLQVLITHVRLLRKTKGSNAQEYIELSERIKQMLKQGEIIDAIDSYPALLRELAAELGEDSPILLEKAIRILGIEVRGGADTQLLAKAIAEKDNAIALLLDVDIIKDYANDKVSKASAWLETILNLNYLELKESVQKWRQELLSTTGSTKMIDRVLVSMYRNSVEASLKRTEQKRNLLS